MKSRRIYTWKGCEIPHLLTENEFRGFFTMVLPLGYDSPFSARIPKLCRSYRI